MTVIARRIPSVPRRTPGATWNILCELFASAGSTARKELDCAQSIASMLIAEECLADSPAILTGLGPQVRFYTLHGNEAIEGEDPPPLSLEPAEGDWRLCLPAKGDDLALAEEVLLRFEHITVYDVEEPRRAIEASVRQSGAKVSIDLGNLAS